MYCDDHVLVFTFLDVLMVMYVEKCLDAIAFCFLMMPLLCNFCKDGKRYIFQLSVPQQFHITVWQRLFPKILGHDAVYKKSCVVKSEQNYMQKMKISLTRYEWLLKTAWTALDRMEYIEKGFFSYQIFV